MDEPEIRRALDGARPKDGCRALGADDMAKVAIALRAGATIGAAAAAAGFAPCTVRRARLKWPAFDAACKEAIAAAHERMNRLPSTRPVPAMKRLKYGPGMPPRFTTDRKKLYLEHFAATLDLHASAKAAGVGCTTVFYHRRDDSVFAAGCIAARALGIERLTDELARQRLAAAEKLRVEGDRDVPEAAAEFDRAMRFVQIYRAQQARAEAAPPPAKWSLEESLDAVEEALRIYKLRCLKEGEDDCGDD